MPDMYWPFMLKVYAVVCIIFMVAGLLLAGIFLQEMRNLWVLIAIVVLLAGLWFVLFVIKDAEDYNRED